MLCVLGSLNIRIVNLQRCPEHIECLAHWHHAEWSYLNPEQSFAQRIERMQSYLCDDFMPSTWVALGDQGQPLGSAAIRDYDMDTHMQLSPWLASVFVDPQRRKQGIGSALVQQVMDLAQAHGFKQLYLFTPDQAALYQRLGWQIIESCAYHGTQVDVMSVTL